MIRQNLNKAIIKSITPRSSKSILCYFSDIKKIPVLTPEEELDLIKKVQENDESAKAKLISSNLRFVISVAKQYCNKGLDFEDLMSEAALGLITAADKYSDKHNTRFLTYAVWWMRKYILNALLDKRNQIRLPQSQQWAYRKIEQSLIKLNNQDIVASIDKIAQESGLNEDTIIRVLNGNASTVSDTDEETDIFANIADTSNFDYEKTDLSELLYKAIDKLSPVQQEIISMKFGLGLNNPMSIDDIASVLHWSSRQVLDQYKSAIIKLRKYFI